MTVDVLSQRHLAEATEELRLIESLAPAGSAGFGSRTTRRETAQPREGVESAEQWELPTPDQDRDKEKDDRPSKWRRPDAKGPGGRGKGRNGNGAKDKTYENSSWEQQQGHWETHPRHWEDHRAEGQLKELRQLRHSVDLLTTLVLRHDNQLTINAQDTAYMIFVRTDIPGNLAAILYEAGQAWNAIKEATPEKLSAPMRIILMQKLLSVVLQRFTQIMEPGDKQEQAKQLGWLSADGKDMHAMMWDPERKRHVLNPAIPATSVDTIKEALTEMIVLCQTPRAVNRFHATRDMAEMYESPTLAFMLDVGLRTAEAGQMWQHMNKLAHSSVWVVCGAYSRHARLQRNPLAQKVAQMQGRSKGNNRYR